MSGKASFTILCLIYTALRTHLQHSTMECCKIYLLPLFESRYKLKKSLEIALQLSILSLQRRCKKETSSGLYRDKNAHLKLLFLFLFHLFASRSSSIEGTHYIMFSLLQVNQQYLRAQCKKVKTQKIKDVISI